MSDLTIFTVDDEAWTVGFWDGCDADRVFSPAVLDGTDTLAGAIEYAERNLTCPTIFVLDSRMYLPPELLARVASDLSSGYGFKLRMEEVSENLNGFLVGCWIRSLSEIYRVILLTAFAQEIDSKLQADSTMREMYDRAIAKLFAKSDGRAVKRAVRDLLREFCQELDRRASLRKM